MFTNHIHRYYTATYTAMSAASVILGVLFNQRFAASCTEEDRADAIDDVEHAQEILGAMEESPIALMAAEAVAGALTRYQQWTMRTDDGAPVRRHQHVVGNFRKELQEDVSADSDPERDYWMQWITEIELLGTVY